MNKENYRKINEPINSNLYSVQNKEYQWGVVDDSDNVVVEFGKYAWIDGFQNGLAKVIGHNDNTSPNKSTLIFEWDSDDEDAKEEEKYYEQGIINESGEEVLPLEYNIWKFYGKDFPTIKAFKDGVEHKYYFSQLNPDFIEDEDDDSDNSYYDDYPDYDQMERDTWDAMTDGQYGDMPEGFDGDYSFLGY